MNQSEETEFCSTPRSECGPQNPAVSFVSATPTTLESPVGSEESEADVIERNVRMRDATEMYQLSSEIQPTTVLSSPIMHTRETPKITSYFDSTSTQYLPQPEVQQEAAPVKPSAPPLPEQPLNSNRDQVPLFDISSMRTGSPSKDPKVGGHLGRRPTHISPPCSPTQIPDPTHTATPSQESISPILSPDTMLNLQTSIHWYYSNPDGSWTPFSFCDSTKIEEAFVKLGETSSSDKEREVWVSCDGGRYTVNLDARQRISIYWDGVTSAVRRCSWFYRGNNDIMQPYNEDKAKVLEEHYHAALKLKSYPMRVELSEGEVVIINSRNMMVQYSTAKVDPKQAEQIAPKLVKRGIPEADKIPPDEKEEIDHLIFVLHGIGSVSDLKFHSFVHCVGDMRAKCQELMSQHWDKISGDKISGDKNTRPGRIEFLPVQWHAALHTDTLGVDKYISKLTLSSIPLLRRFINGTCVDVLFYTSPFYCEAIIQQCGSEINRLYNLFKSRNPSFKGKVSLTGHSLGAVIAFDILLQQHANNEEVGNETRAVEAGYHKSKYLSGNTSGTGEPTVSPVKLQCDIENLFALGSPLGLFLAVRGIHSLEQEFKLPTCKHFYNIFHPYDPVAYKLEPLVLTKDTEPVTLPHHKGRKRMHKEISEQIVKVGFAVRNTISNTLLSFYGANSEEQGSENADNSCDNTTSNVNLKIKDTVDEVSNETAAAGSHDKYGLLNCGKRIDYVLQESPLEMVNEYIFSLSSHLCYWSSDDTVLFMIREVFKHEGSIESHLPLV